jgi:hypothetical protein
MIVSPNELRLGNYVNTCSDFGGSSFIYSISPSRIMTRTNGAYQEFYKEDIQGITLTPELLKKCGFVAYDESDNCYTTYGNHNDDSDFFLQFDWRHRDRGYTPLIKADSYETIGESIKYLHQLQNLYHALTNEELPITF